MRELLCGTAPGALKGVAEIQGRTEDGGDMTGPILLHSVSLNKDGTVNDEERQLQVEATDTITFRADGVSKGFQPPKQTSKRSLMSCCIEPSCTQTLHSHWPRPALLLNPFLSVPLCLLSCCTWGVCVMVMRCI